MVVQKMTLKFNIKDWKDIIYDKYKDEPLPSIFIEKEEKEEKEEEEEGNN